MSWFPSPAEADWWYDLSWKGIIGFGALAAFATAATVIFTVIQFWSDGVRDHKADARTNAMELRLAQSNERAAALEKDAAEARLKYERLRKEFAWREIRQDDAERIARALRVAALRPAVFTTSNDPETINFREVILIVLRLAGDPQPRWSASVIGTPFRGLAVQGPNVDDRRALIAAFDAGAIRLDDAGQSDSLTIIIGAKPLNQ